MPQMMPMNWIFMFMMLNMTVIITLIMFFNHTTNKPSTSDYHSHNIMKSWMW